MGEFYAREMVIMDISFKSKKLEKSFNEGAQLEKIHGASRARKIRIRMKELRAAKNLMDFWPPKKPARAMSRTDRGATIRPIVGGFGSSIPSDFYA
jgi:hypothetical protein